VFIHSVLFTLLYTAIVTGPILVLGYAMAAFVRANRPGSVVFRTAFFLPFIVGLATESFMLLLELQPDSGVVDNVLAKLGLASLTTAWTVHYDLALGVICVFVVWFASGLTMMILMDRMQGILFSWTEFVGALTFLTSNSLYTLPLALLNMAYSSVGQVNFGYLEAGAVIAMIPCVVLYIALQRYYIRGLTSGVVKG